jgi:hypothetical protein
VSQENVEIVRPIYDALNRRGWDAVFSAMHVDFELPIQRLPQTGTYQGREILRLLSPAADHPWTAVLSIDKSPPLKLAVALALSLATIPLGACGSGSGPDGTTSFQPQIPPSAESIDPSNFVRRVDNPYFPLKPGATYRHRGVKEEKRAVDVFAVTHLTRKVLGVANTVVDDKLYVDGRLEEIAHDWYAQDREGNVWYFGETIKDFNPKGKRIPAQGAWEAGIGGARPGIVMPAQPKVGDTFRPEYYKGTAEDVYQILDLSAKVTVPDGSFMNVLVMSERSQLEPGVLGLKYHARGFGQIKESVAKGPHERLGLVSVARGR